VACRAVRRLTNFTNRDAEIYGASCSHSAQGQFRSGAPHTSGNPKIPTLNVVRHSPNSGVHVQMETFTRQEPCDDIFNSKQGPNGSETDVELDVEAKGSFWRLRSYRTSWGEETCHSSLTAYPPSSQPRLKLLASLDWWLTACFFFSRRSPFYFLSISRISGWYKWRIYNLVRIYSRQIFNIQSLSILILAITPTDAWL